MKKIWMILLTTLLVGGATAQDIKLPEPNRHEGKPLFDVLTNRQTMREFGTKSLDEQTLSNLLWCANGVNRDNGRRTAPSARNCQEIEVFAFTEKGVYLYNAKENSLELKIEGDLRNKVSQQEKLVKAPVVLLFFANYDKMKDFSEEAREFYGATDAGYVSQNVYLFCASEELNTVVLGFINRDELRGMLKMNGKAILAQPVGYPVQ